MAETSDSSPQDASKTKVIQSVDSFPAPRIASTEVRDSLPHRYGMDHLQIMVQSPFQVFVYWEVTLERIQEALRGFPRKDQRAFHLALRWIEGGQIQQHTFDSGATSEWWFQTRPRTRYQAVLCLQSEEFGNISLLNSNEVETPSNSLTEISLDDEPSETMEVLSQLIQLTGLNQESTKSESPSVDNGSKEVGTQSRSEIDSCFRTERLPAEITRPTSSFW